MNETEQVESVFGGKKPADTSNGAGDKDARIAELERELQTQRVEYGRLKKANEENAALREENARLKEQKGVDAAIASVPDDVRSEVAPEVLRASGAMMASVSQSVSERMARDNERIAKDFEDQKEEIRRLREENAQRDRNLFTQRVNLQYPGFLDSVSDGGDKHDAWVRYQRFNAASIVNALNANDFDAIAYHIEMFCREIGVPVPSGNGGSATPDPRSSCGNHLDERNPLGKTYTPEEFNSLFDMKEAARDRGDYAEVRRLSEEINRAPAEGRVKE